MGSHPLRLFWVAWYDKQFPAGDAETLPQFDPHTGKENLFREIDQTRIKSMVLFPFSVEFAELVNQGGEALAYPAMLPRYVVHLGDGKRLIYVRRNMVTFRDLKNPQLLGRGIIYLLGWQRTELIHHNGHPQKRNRKSVMFIAEDGAVALVDKAGTPDEQMKEAPN